VSETFIRAHIDRLPCTTIPIWGWRPSVAGRPVLSAVELAGYKVRRWVTGEGLERETTAAFVRAFTRYRVQAVLGEYGDISCHAIDACQQAGIPLIAHFHGYDSSRRDILRNNVASYRKLFRTAAAIVVVSRAMERRLVSLGAPPELLVYGPYGVDCERFSGAAPATAPPTLLAVGRFTEKKAPHLTLLAFAQAVKRVPDARLRMIGAGPLQDACVDLAEALRITHAVTFLDAQGPEVVSRELRSARAFVQHSLEAPNGDSEGTPVAIIEAGATGLPVISTRHGGIPDVVVEGETGLLSDERDVDGMAAQMVTLLTDAALAGRMGAAAQGRVRQHFTMDQSLARLAALLGRCIDESRDRSTVRRMADVVTTEQTEVTASDQGFTTSRPV
jgi:glycosyltransferase involved in cell wall biosynthesis